MQAAGRMLAERSPIRVEDRSVLLFRNVERYLVAIGGRQIGLLGPKRIIRLMVIRVSGPSEQLVPRLALMFGYVLGLWNQLSPMTCPVIAVLVVVYDV